MTKTLMVCGCSFSAKPFKLKHSGTHFSEILAKRLGYTLINTAYAGCSNGGVRIQIDEVIRQKPDFAIIIPTFSDRIEIPVTGLKPDYDKLSWLELDNFLKTETNYDESKGLNNINCAGSLDPSLICENFTSLVNNWKHDYRNKKPLKSEVVEALKLYVSYLYDSNWKKQQDRWIIEHGALEMVHNNIPFILIPTIWLWRDYMGEPKLLDKKYYTQHPDHCPLAISNRPEYSLNGDWDNDPGYHTLYSGQEFLAEKYFELIRERWGLC